MTHADHLADDLLSELVDDQRSAAQVSPAEAHLETCAVCQARLAELRALVGLLRALPSVEPPRDFRLGPRLVVDPPNVVRLQRWYAVTRVAAGALAAAFVFLSAGTLYVDSRPVASTASLASKAQPAPDVVAQDAVATSGPAPTPGPRAPAAAPALAPQPPQPAAPAAPAAGAAVRSNQAAASPTSAEPGDQIAAATTVRPLPTQVPTPTLVARLPTPVASAAPSTPLADPAAPLRTAAAFVGILAALGILVALLIRHRLLAVSPSHLE